MSVRRTAGPLFLYVKIGMGFVSSLSSFGNLLVQTVHQFGNLFKANRILRCNCGCLLGREIYRCRRSADLPLPQHTVNAASPAADIYRPTLLRVAAAREYGYRACDNNFLRF